MLKIQTETLPGVRAGCPNLIEQIEGGLLSYGNDMTRPDNPFECGPGKFCKLDAVPDCIGHTALGAIAGKGPAQQIRAIAISGEAMPPCDRAWPLWAGETRVGQGTSAAFSPDFASNVAIGMVAATHWAAGTRLGGETQTGRREAQVRDWFWA